MKKLLLLLLLLTPLTSCNSKEVEIKLISHLVNNSNNSYIIKSAYKYIIDCYEVEDVNTFPVTPSIAYNLKVDAKADDLLEKTYKAKINSIIFISISFIFNSIDYSYSNYYSIKENGIKRELNKANTSNNQNTLDINVDYYFSYLGYEYKGDSISL